MIRRLLFGDPLLVAKQRIEDAMRKHAQVVSDIEYYRVLRGFYTQRALSLDPNDNWWEFADAKQKESDHAQELGVLRSRAEETLARLDAAKARFVQLHDGPAGAGKGGA